MTALGHAQAPNTQPTQNPNRLNRYAAGTLIGAFLIGSGYVGHKKYQEWTALDEFLDDTSYNSAPVVPGQDEVASPEVQSVSYSDAELDAMTGNAIEQYFEVPDEIRVNHIGAELSAMLPAAHEKMQTALRPDEAIIINEPRPADKSSYTDSMVFAEISEAIVAAGMVADDTGDVDRAIMMHSAAVSPNDFDHTGLIRDYNKIAQPGMGPHMYVFEVLSGYNPINGGTFMGNELGNHEGRVIRIRDTRSNNITTNLAVLFEDSNGEGHWMSVDTLTEGATLRQELAELGSTAE